MHKINLSLPLDKKAQNELLHFLQKFETNNLCSVVRVARGPNICTSHGCDGSALYKSPEYQVLEKCSYFSWDFSSFIGFKVHVIKGIKLFGL